MIRGTPPPTVPLPTVDGYYWLRLASPRWVYIPELSDEPSRSYSTWENCKISIELIQFNDDVTYWMGDNQGPDLDMGELLLIEVISNIEEPT